MNAFEQNPVRGVRALSIAVKAFGRYEAHVEIGDGAMGRVYRGFDPMVGRVVAIKTVKSEYLTKETRTEYLRRFRREAQAAGRLSHPSIVGIFDVGEDYFVMEYVEGITLSELLRYRTVLDVPSTLRLLAPVAEALDYAHRSGVVHRDIKPSNIMVQPDGRPKLMDFGVARLETSAMTSSGQFFGSPSYMAPEQILGVEVDRQADLFSFAVVAYETLTGRRPFQGDSITSIIYRVVNEAPALPRTVNAELPPRFDETFRRALSKQPSQRYPSAMEFMAALAGEELETSLADLVPEPIPEAQAARPRVGELETQAIHRGPVRRRWLPWLVPAVAVLALAVEIGLLVGTAPAPRPAEGAGVPTTPEALRIETQPEGARVWIDGEEVGQAPLAVADVAPGTHRVRVQQAGYAPAELGLQVSAGITPPPLRFIMTPLSAPLRVTSEPATALVRLDGSTVGATPLDQLPLSPGRHEVRVELRGFRPSVHRVEAQPGEAIVIEARLEPVPPAAPPPFAEKAAAVRVPEPALTPVPVMEGMFVAADDVDARPRRLKGDWARYPEAARQLRQTGRVTVDMLITETGETADLRIVESAGAVLDDAVLKAMRGWRFEPARKDGVKVRTRIESRQEFR